jgi:hypothetical protein
MQKAKRKLEEAREPEWCPKPAGAGVDDVQTRSERHRDLRRGERPPERVVHGDDVALPPQSGTPRRRRWRPRMGLAAAAAAADSVSGC